MHSPKYIVYYQHDPSSWKLLEIHSNSENFGREMKKTKQLIKTIDQVLGEGWRKDPFNNVHTKALCQTGTGLTRRVGGNYKIFFF